MGRADEVRVGDPIGFCTSYRVLVDPPDSFDPQVTLLRISLGEGPILVLDVTCSVVIAANNTAIFARPGSLGCLWWGSNVLGV